MAKTLGLSFFFHDSAAAIVVDGKVVAAAAEERFCRRKHTSEFPKMAIEYCLYAAGIECINDIDAIVFYEKPVLKLFRAVETMVLTWPKSYENFVNKLPTLISSKINILDTIHAHLPGYKGKILFSEHHLSHAASAFFCSPYKDAAVLTIDGVGEWETTTVGRAKGREITLDYAIQFPHSIGLLYSALTSYLGFKVNDGEWKVMGLAPYGEPKYVEQFKKLVHMKPDGSFQLNLNYFAHHYSAHWTANNMKWEALFGFSHRDSASEINQIHENLACSGQAVVEELILNLARQAKKISGSDNLVIAGGVGLNSVANWKIQNEQIFKNVWIQPAAGDDGGALGAALLVSQTVLNDPPCEELKNAYLGPAYTDREIKSFLESRDIAYEWLEDKSLIDKVANWLADNKVMGWFSGAMEFGPRSLGARSILANPTSYEMKSVINRKVKFREYFRPFAPAIPIENVHEYFDVAPNTDMPFMLKVPQVRLNKRKQIPAVTHEDGTGRVQTVRREDNPMYYALIKAFESKTGVPVLLNTSFNVRGEPIVCTPKDAYDCFLNTEIDALVLGNCFIAKRHDHAIDLEHLYKRSDALEKAIGTNDENDQTSTAVLAIESVKEDEKEVVTAEVTAQRVLNFYKELPFNYYSNSLDTTVELLKENRVKAYPVVHKHLRRHNNLRVVDIGCGAGWFSNSCAHYYNADVTGIEVNPVVLKQAKAVSSLFPGNGKTAFIETDLFKFKPNALFDIANSLGVLHHTPDCHAAIRRVLKWVKPGGYCHIGLYHRYGRKPFLDHFLHMREKGASELALYEEFARLNPNITDKTHMMSWFRDQVLHPHETQHTYEEIAPLIEHEGFSIKATSINHDKPNPDFTKMVKREKKYEALSRKALKTGRYFPGFFVVWAKRT